MKKDYEKYFTNNIHCQELNINGESMMMVNVIGMMNEQQMFYEKVKKKFFLWNTDNFSYFIDDHGRICGNVKAIGKIKNDNLLTEESKNKNLRIIDLGKPEIYRNYYRMTTWKNNDDKRCEKMSCVDKMIILKDIGNKIKKAKDLDTAAMLLYLAAIDEFGECDGAHKSCREKKGNTKIHDDMLSKLLHDISLLYLEKNELESSAIYARSH